LRNGCLQCRLRVTKETSHAPRVVDGGHGPEFDEIGDAQLRELESRGKLTFLDIRERDLIKAGHRPGAINILVDELNSRARVELPLDRTVVVDCSQGSTRWCHVAGAFLRELGFTRVVIYIP
jgi:rhodanese-related sulfurtransferase